MIIREEIESPLKLLSESSGGKKNWYLKGIAAQAERINKNNRLYPAHILEREINKYDREMIRTGRAMGELEHPSEAKINLDRVSHLFKEVKRHGNDWHAKALILDETPCGSAVKGIIAGGGRLGFSTRCLGSLYEARGHKIVGDDLSMVTLSDVVGEPSAPDAWTQGILENIDEYIAMENCELICEAIADTRRYALRKSLIREGSQRKIDTADLFRRFWNQVNR